jgi:hypothetical protein
MFPEIDSNNIANPNYSFFTRFVSICGLLCLRAWGDVKRSQQMVSTVPSF